MATTTCQLCGSPLDKETRVVSVRLRGAGAVPAIEEENAPAEHDGVLASLCADHLEAIRLLRRVCPDVSQVEERVRSTLYQELDVLAFALEMEASEALKQDREAAAARAQQTRLGVRLAQRLVGGVPAPEVDERLRQWRDTYESRFPR